MTKHWKRRFQVQVGGQNLNLDDMQVEVQIRLAEIEHPDWAYVRIINLSRETSNKIFQKDVAIQIHGGYHEGPYGMLFEGAVNDMRRGKLNGTDRYHDIIAQSGGKAYSSATVNKTISAGQTLEDVAKAAIEAMTQLEGSQLRQGYLDPALKAKTLTRSWDLNSEARNVLRNIADSTDTSWIIENNELRIASNKTGLPGGAAKISVDSGMIGIPEQQLYGIVVRVLMNPGYKLQQMVHIDPESINAFLHQGPSIRDDKGLLVPLPTGKAVIVPGIAQGGMYRIIRIDHDGEMRGQPWYTTLTCLDPQQEGSAATGGGPQIGQPPLSDSGRGIPEDDQAKSGNGGGGGG